LLALPPLLLALLLALLLLLELLLLPSLSLSPSGTVITNTPRLTSSWR
jgi:hypothetical protein